MKKYIIYLVSSLLVFNSSVSYAEDYTKNSSNPFKTYEYKSEWEQHIINQNNMNKSKNINNNAVNYFTNKIENPITVKKTGKYKYLINNAHKINGCWDQAGSAYNVDPWLLFAIAKVESSFNYKAINLNKDKSKSSDFGLMQINSWWLPTLQKFGITKEHLFDPCTSIFIGAWIVAQNIKRFGYNQDGIGAYNSPNNITIRRNYASKVYSAYNELVNDFGIDIKKVKN